MKRSSTPHSSLLLCLLLATFDAGAYTVKPCGALRSEIEKKIRAQGVVNFTLVIVDAHAEANGKVVASCDGGTKKIVYLKGRA